MNADDPLVVAAAADVPGPRRALRRPTATCAPRTSRTAASRAAPSRSAIGGDDGPPCGCRFPGRHNVGNALAAAALASLAGAPLEAMRAALERFERAEHADAGARACRAASR